MRHRLFHALLGLAALLACGAGMAAPPVRLPGFNVDISQTSVSGLSSGAFMAVQFEVAHSSIVKGAGIVAGGPYYCARNNAGTAISVCSCTTYAPLCQNAPGATDVPGLIQATEDFAQQGAIDPTSHLHGHRVFLFSGKLDGKVPAPVMQDLASYYRHFLPAAQLRSVTTVKADHAMPTQSFGNPCGTSSTPYINNCHYDAAGELLRWIYGNLHPKRSGTVQGTLLQFDQREFLPAGAPHGLDASGWLFVPHSCEQGATCRVHVAFHGCQQGQAFLPLGLAFAPIAAPYGTTFVEHAGYNRWADTNDLVVLYPQAIATLLNPLGCWDWWGYDDANYATRAGHQVAAVRAMVDRIASGRP